MGRIYLFLIPYKLLGIVQCKLINSHRNKVTSTLQTPTHTENLWNYKILLRELRDIHYKKVLVVNYRKKNVDRDIVSCSIACRLLHLVDSQMEEPKVQWSASSWFHGFAFDW